MFLLFYSFMFCLLLAFHEEKTNASNSFFPGLLLKSIPFSYKLFTVKCLSVKSIPLTCMGSILSHKPSLAMKSQEHITCVWYTHMYVFSCTLYQLSCFEFWKPTETSTKKFVICHFHTQNCLTTNVQVLKSHRLVASYSHKITFFLICAKPVSLNTQFLTLVWYFHSISP